MIARKLAETDLQTILEWDGVYGGVGNEVICDGQIYRIDGVRKRGPNASGKFVTVGFSWTSAYHTQEAAKTADHQKEADAAATTDRC